MTDAADQKSIGVYELKAHLSSVLEEVLAGTIITVTRHGHPVARIVPASATSTQDRRAAIDRITVARRGRKLGQAAKAAVNAGRR